MKATRVKLNDAQGGKSQDGSPLKGRIFKWGSRVITLTTAILDYFKQIARQRTPGY